MSRAGLLLALALAAIFRILYFTGLQTGDDIVYSRIAVDRLNGKVQVTMTQETRTGFLLPMVASYAVLGPGEAPLLLYNVLCSLGLVAAVWFLARRFYDWRGATAAAMVVACHPILVRYASECHADTPLALWIALAVLVFLSALDDDPGFRRRILCGLILGWAYLHKESAIYMGLFFAGHWVATRRDWKWYLPIAIPVAAVFIVECIGFAAVAGNPLARYAMIRHWHAGQYMAERYTTVGSILHRQFLELPKLLFTPWYGRNGTGLINLACLAAGAFFLWKRDPGARLAAGWFLVFTAAYCFWPSSLSPFLPGFFLFEWTLPVFGAPLALFLAGLRGKAGFLIPGILIVSVITLRAASDQGDAFTAGARDARAWLEKNPAARVIADDKTIENLDFFEGHRPSRQYTPFQEAKEFAGTVVIVDRFWTEPGKWWSRPAPSVPSSWRKVHETARITIYRP
jgi:4-amino-4-deoxy-L-arabinose transferase-like glycosyltransferase